MVVGMQYGSGYSVWRRQSSVRWKIFCTDVSHHKYGGGASSVQWRVCSMDLSHHQYRGGCAVQDYQNCSKGCWWLYFSLPNGDLKAVVFGDDRTHSPNLAQMHSEHCSFQK